MSENKSNKNLEEEKQVVNTNSNHEDKGAHDQDEGTISMTDSSQVKTRKGALSQPSANPTIKEKRDQKASTKIKVPASSPAKVTNKSSKQMPFLEPIHNQSQLEPLPADTIYQEFITLMRPLKKYIVFGEVFMQVLDFSMNESTTVSYDLYKLRVDQHLDHMDILKRRQAEYLQFLYRQGNEASYYDAITQLVPYYEFRLNHTGFNYPLAIQHITAEIPREPGEISVDYDTMLYQADRDINEETQNKNKGSAHYLFVNRKDADQQKGYLVNAPPSNDEVEILGIEVRVSDRKQQEQDYTKRDNTNVNNYVCLVRFRADEGRIGYHIPYVLPLNCLQQYLSYFTPKTQKLIGEYCVYHYPAVKKYNDVYWHCRYQAMNKKSQEARFGNSIIRNAVSPTSSVTLQNSSNEKGTSSNAKETSTDAIMNTIVTSSNVVQQTEQLPSDANAMQNISLPQPKTYQHGNGIFKDWLDKGQVHAIAQKMRPQLPPAIKSRVHQGTFYKEFKVQYNNNNLYNWYKTKLASELNVSFYSISNWVQEFSDYIHADHVVSKAWTDYNQMMGMSDHYQPPMFQVQESAFNTKAQKRHYSQMEKQYNEEIEDILNSSAESVAILTQQNVNQHFGKNKKKRANAASYTQKQVSEFIKYFNSSFMSTFPQPPPTTTMTTSNVNLQSPPDTNEVVEVSNPNGSGNPGGQDKDNIEQEYHQMRANSVSHSQSQPPPMVSKVCAKEYIVDSQIELPTGQYAILINTCNVNMDGQEGENSSSQKGHVEQQQHDDNPSSSQKGESEPKQDAKGDTESEPVSGDKQAQHQDSQKSSSQNDNAEKQASDNENEEGQDDSKKCSSQKNKEEVKLEQYPPTTINQSDTATGTTNLPSVSPQPTPTGPTYAIQLTTPTPGNNPDKITDTSTDNSSVSAKDQKISSSQDWSDYRREIKFTQWLWLGITQPDWSKWQAYRDTKDKSLQSPKHWALWQWFNKNHYVVNDKDFKWFVDDMEAAVPTETELATFMEACPRIVDK